MPNSSNPPKIAEPLPAASVIVVRDVAQGLEVLMIERAKTMRFAPGAFVFPGGKVDAHDMDQKFWLDHSNGNKTMPDLAFRIAALRELYEEAALLITDSSASSADSDQAFLDHIQCEQLKLNVADMAPFAHWVTPEPMPRRFDTHFYIVEHNGQEALHDGQEAVSLRWVNPKTILAEWGMDKVPLMFPTRLNLMKLARASSVQEAMEQARGAKVVRTLPVVGQDENGIKLTIDPACGYDVTIASSKELRVETPK
jgi:8-oxo-dGTP pyrophosphatase MutT (NUDIX family)